MTEEEKKELDNLIYTLHIHHIDTSILFKMKDTIQKQQEEIEKKDKIIDEMAETILEDTVKLDTYWCNGCSKVAECPYENTKKCIKQYFESKV